MELVSDKNQRLVLGFGGAGCSMLDALLKDSSFASFYINTADNLSGRRPEQCLSFITDHSLLSQVEDREDEITALFNGYSEIFILVGLGGGTGASCHCFLPI
ncbi:hypothetical protein OURE66S_03295 [Oligella ureolytica]